MVLGPWFRQLAVCKKWFNPAAIWFSASKKCFRPLGMSFVFVDVAWDANRAGLEDVLMTFDEHVEHAFSKV